MDPSKRVGITVAIFISLISGCANLQCKLFEANELVCTADNDNYIVRKGAFSGVTQATKITLRNCLITRLETGAFTEVSFLTHIDLSQNKISNLPNALLANDMTHLNLSHNQLTTLPAELFGHNTNLKVLDLSSNRINSIPRDVFVALSKLDRLDLSDNAFLGNSLSPFTFSRVAKITFLDFSRNNMSDSSKNLLNTLENLNFLNMDGCSLKDIPQFATKANLRTITHLILSDNQITKLNEPRTFIALTDVKVLNLAENLIDNVAADVFKYLENLKVIILRDNKLKILPDECFRKSVQLKSVDLSHNMLEHVPYNAFRGTVMKELNLSTNRISYLDVDFFLKLRNAGVIIKNFYFDDNPWQCACLNDLLKEVKLFGIEYNVANGGGENWLHIKLPLRQRI